MELTNAPTRLAARGLFRTYAGNDGADGGFSHSAEGGDDEDANGEDGEPHVQEVD